MIFKEYCWTNCPTDSELENSILRTSLLSGSHFKQNIHVFIHLMQRRYNVWAGYNLTKWTL